MLILINQIHCSCSSESIFSYSIARSIPADQISLYSEYEKYHEPKVHFICYLFNLLLFDILNMVVKYYHT